MKLTGFCWEMITIMENYYVTMTNPQIILSLLTNNGNVFGQLDSYSHHFLFKSVISIASYFEHLKLKQEQDDLSSINAKS